MVSISLAKSYRQVLKNFFQYMVINNYVIFFLSILLTEFLTHEVFFLFSKIVSIIR